MKKFYDLKYRVHNKMKTFQKPLEKKCQTRLYPVNLLKSQISSETSFLDT